MDPEDLREVIATYQKCVAETVRRFGGFVAKYMGDGVLVYFGYPQVRRTMPKGRTRGGPHFITLPVSLRKIHSFHPAAVATTGRKL